MNLWLGVNSTDVIIEAVWPRRRVEGGVETETESETETEEVVFVVVVVVVVVAARTSPILSPVTINKGNSVVAGTGRILREAAFFGRTKV